MPVDSVCRYSHGTCHAPSPGEGASGLSALLSSFPLVVALLLAGCASSPRVEPDGSLVRHYLGYVKVVVPQAESRYPLYTADTTVLGIRVGDGIGVGYVRDRQVHVPLDCRVVLLVANQAQLDHALRQLPALKDQPHLCTAVDSALAQPGETP